MTGYEFEHFVASYLKSIGYHNVQVTQASGDFGIDVTATKNKIHYAIQCKYYTHPVGNAAVQEVVAGMAYYGCQKAMVVTNNIFTKSAQNLATVNDVILLDNISPETVHIKNPSPFSHNMLISILFWFLSFLFFAAAIDLLFDGKIGPCFVGLCFALPYPITKLKKFLKSKKRNFFKSDHLIPDTEVLNHELPDNKSDFSDDPYLRYLIKKHFYKISDTRLLEAIYCIISREKASISILQRYFKIGFNDAASLMDDLYSLGIVGPDLGSKPREILITIDDLEIMTTI